MILLLLALLGASIIRSYVLRISLDQLKDDYATLKDEHLDLQRRQF